MNIKNILLLLLFYELGYILLFWVTPLHSEAYLLFGSFDSYAICFKYTKFSSDVDGIPKATAMDRFGKLQLDEEAPSTSKDVRKEAQGSRKSKPGKNSAQRRQDNFRKQRNAEVSGKLINSLGERLGILDDSGPSTLETVVRSKAKEISAVAIPLSITTRGVGFATAMTFDRLVTSFEGKPPEVPISIFQMYRVHLWASYYKMFLSNALTSEVPSFPTPIVNIDSMLVHVLEHIKVLPSVMSAILDCIGKVETPTATYFACFVEPPVDNAIAVEEHHATMITPANIRDLIQLATHGTDEQRQRVRELWSIPGARFSDDGRLENGDEIYPPVYGHDQLLADVQTYMAFTVRVRKRFPQHLIRDIVWSGNATTGMLWSTPILEVGLTSHFQVVSAPITNRRRKRMDGTYAEFEAREIQVAKYLRATVPSDGLCRFTS